MTTCSCGTEQKEVDRESTVRQYVDRFSFSDLSLNKKTEVKNPFRPSALYELATAPNARADIEGPSLEIERSEDTFCPNFAEHQEAYDRLVAQAELIEAATQNVPAAEVETAVDVEMVRSKIEHLPSQVPNLSEAELEQLQDELTAMQASLSGRLEQLEGSQPATLRESLGGSNRAQRLILSAITS